MKIGAATDKDLFTEILQNKDRVEIELKGLEITDNNIKHLLDKKSIGTLDKLNKIRIEKCNIGEFKP